MKKKDILELKKRFKKNDCTFTKICGCYVNGEKNIIFNFRETFLNLDEDEYFKYLEIAKKVLSGTIGNNILELNFPLNENLENEKQISLIQLKKSQLKDDALLQDFYKSIIDSYDYTGNFLILVFHDAYDIITKTTDNAKMDESEEVYEYILCAICPVSLSNPGLRYFEEENKIKARIRDWVVDAPTLGFVFPAFINRSSDVNSVMYYTKNAKDPHPELMEKALGCSSKQTATIQKETFQTIIKDYINTDEKKAEKTFIDIQENLNTMIDEYNAIYDDTDGEPITLTQKDIQNLLIESGVPEEATTKIEKSYLENFGVDLPLAENLIDSKVLKANAQRKKEEQLEKQVETLQARLEDVTQAAAVDNEIPLSTEVNDDNVVLEEADDTSSEDNTVTSHYDVILQVKPEKIPQIKYQIINGQKCIVIPINENEQTTVNGLTDLI
ncbi:DUF4317 domain-containing protein [Clostridium gasigenes]|uniref:DUF4317 domain-containing protein n=1 Tax=Clostridium gasigenes TaxID=94869 RepID=UPI0014386CFC|nr:DUF4317 domain-containing protein [Clostridium gasigenes]NKF06598.1 DUF4317 domain-containing protein [Clostridium gasigenes]QSW21049.1 DUF4317 domain-containing protein [Clostridium gasigenes]